MASADSQVEKLGLPLHLEVSGVTVPNRLMKAALTERLASWDAQARSECGVPSEELICLYRAWGAAGYGMVITGNIIVDVMNLEAPGNMVIPSGEPTSGLRFERYRTLAREAQSNGTLLLGQLSHAGRQAKAQLQPHPISASNMPLGQNFLKISTGQPRAASVADIDQIVDDFAHSAAYLDQAGFGGVQLHAAHGYLLSQFLSRVTNQRDDEYGAGCMRDRARIISRIAGAIRQRTRRSFVLAIKINSVEFEEGGFGPTEAAELGALLDEAGFDVVELSGGTYKEMAFEHRKESTVRREAFFLDFAEQITALWTPRRARLYVTGGFQTVRAMEAALDTVDGVGIGRATTMHAALAEELLQRKRQQATPLCVRASDFGATTAVCGSQLRQMAEGRPPMDGSNMYHVMDFFQDAQEWRQAQEDDPEAILHRWMQWAPPGSSPRQHWSDDLTLQGRS